MSEEKETQEGGMSGIKKTIAGLVATAVTAAGGYVATHIEAIFGGGEEEEEKTEVVQPAVEQKQKQEQNVQVSGPTINLTIPEQKAAPAPTQIIRERVIEKAAPTPTPAPAPKPVEEESDPW